ncbi:hypothetical protein SPI_04036 [Niveomyces insectorum RCEF 264]|uniref:Uncharacterized protein n=1 Tax=Niveomyces insectorum RCEF 264 TaxID=1081102 RepID=A0A167VDL0_9HYPO|nr:hypothetical protein SPI_04036 [Niveomyces insectorum RCEF 264]
MSNTDKTFNPQVEDPTKPDAAKHKHSLFEEAREKFSAHRANPGPAIAKDVKVPEEGTKEERRARAQELNKDK